jgi:hypothetical protein
MGVPNIYDHFLKDCWDSPDGLPATNPYILISLSISSQWITVKNCQTIIITSSQEVFDDRIGKRTHNFSRFSITSHGSDSGIDKTVKIEKTDHVAKSTLG